MLSSRSLVLQFAAMNRVFFVTSPLIPKRSLLSAVECSNV